MQEWENEGGAIPEVAQPEQEPTAFGRVVPLLMDSYTRKNGRTFDPNQVAALAEGLLDMANTIDSQITYIGELQAEIAGLQEEVEEAKKKKLWQPR